MSGTTKFHQGRGGGQLGGRGQGMGGTNHQTEEAQSFWYISLEGSWRQRKGMVGGSYPLPLARPAHGSGIKIMLEHI